MSNKLQAVRGMNDILPEQTESWQFVEEILHSLLGEYGFSEIRMPIVEKTDLFRRSIGEVTDIVEKEMYSFEDRNGDSLTLRPEGTASCVRACIQHGLLHNQTQRVWYTGPMFRHERPQKGRYRQFHQVGVEVFGLPGPDIDAELLIMTDRLWKRLGIKRVTLQINSLGTVQARTVFKEKLLDYLSGHIDELDEDSQRRLKTNPLRILDSKNDKTQEILEAAPKLQDYIDDESTEHFQKLCALLEQVGISYDVNPRLVRGLDYYGRTVFEWVTDALGAQGTICAGGRYDALVEYLGGRATPAVGFAIGLERLITLIEDQEIALPDRAPHLYFMATGEPAHAQALALSEQLRDELPGIRILNHCGGGSLKSQFKKADRSGARYALILGEDEVQAREVSIKALRTQQDQHKVTYDQLNERVAELVEL